MKLKIALLIATITISTFSTAYIVAAEKKDEATLAVVNGKKITEETLALYARQRNLPPGGASPQQRKALIEELINRELIYQDAITLGVDKSKAIQAEIEHQRVNIIASTMISRSSDRFAVSDQDMRKEYEARKGELGGKEMKARHILLNSKKEAEDIIAKLGKGDDFAKLASSHSTGPSATNGGDLGWFRADQMVKSFADAAGRLKKGSYTKEPVQTQYGWHVILLEDSRSVEAPPFDSIKEQIRVGLQNKLIEQYISGLREKAKIEHR